MQTALLVEMPLWSAAALATSGTLTSPALDMRRADKFEALLCTFSSAAGLAQVKVEYAISQDGVTFGAFTDNAALVLDSSVDFPTPEGINAVPGPALKAPYYQVKLTELSGALSDTLVTVVAQLKEK